jgi:hypothetical protein
MAVTTGYYQRLVDTVLTRARAATPYVYDLGVQFVEGEEGVTEVTSFVGRYLNAARVGSEALESAAAGSTTQAPNACIDCPLQPTAMPRSVFRPRGSGHIRSTGCPCCEIHARLRRSPRVQPRHHRREVVRNVLVECSWP